MQHPPACCPKKMVVPFIAAIHRKHVIYRMKAHFLRNTKMFCYTNMSNSLWQCRAQITLRQTALTPQLSLFRKVPWALKVGGKHNPFLASLRAPAQEWIGPGHCSPVICFHSLLKMYLARPGFWYSWTAFRPQVYDLYAGNRNAYKWSKILHSLLNPLKSRLFLETLYNESKSSPSCKQASSCL